MEANEKEFCSMSGPPWQHGYLMCDLAFTWEGLLG